MAELLPIPSYAASWEEVTKYEEGMLAANSSFGVLEYYGVSRATNQDCFYFMMDQFKRFGIVPIPQSDLLSYCWSTALYYIDTFDPYILFDGVTDVVKTNESYYYQYSVFEDEYGKWVDVNADSIETFKYWSLGAKNWQAIYDHPGLHVHFPHLLDYFTEQFQFVVEDKFSDYYVEEKMLILKYGPKTEDLCHLGIWAALVWMCSQIPEAVTWRQTYHPIFNFCYEDGECLVIDGNHFVPPSHFRKKDRPANSCAKCGIRDWCVDTIDLKESVEFLCEHCLSEGERFPERVCGKRMCNISTCVHHPFFKDTDAKGKLRMIAAANTFGPLRQLPNGLKVRELPGYIIAEMQQVQKIGSSVGDRAAGEAYKNVMGLLGVFKEDI